MLTLLGFFYYMSIGVFYLFADGSTHGDTCPADVNTCTYPNSQCQVPTGSDTGTCGCENGLQYYADIGCCMYSKIQNV